MKLKSIYTFICLVMMIATTSFAQEGSSYKVSGTISGLPEGAVIQLVPESHKNEKPLAEVPIKEGKFEFVGTQKEPLGVYIMVKGSYGSYKFILDNSDISLMGSVKAETQNGNQSYDFENMTTSGSNLTKLYYEKIAPHSALDGQYQAIQKNNAEVLKKIMDARKAKNETLQKELNSSEAGMKLASDEKEFFSNVEKTVNKIILDNKDSWWGPFLLVDMMSYFTPEQKSTYEQFSTEAKNSYYGKLVKDELYPKDLTGTKVPDFTVKNGNKTLALKDLIKGKKYIIIDFWASWCVPCRHEIPNLKKLYALYASKGLQIISISIDKKESDWQKAYEQEKMPWLSYLDRTGAANTYNVKLIPAMFLIDSNGTLISDKLRGETMTEKLKELFK